MIDKHYFFTRLSLFRGLCIILIIIALPLLSPAQQSNVLIQNVPVSPLSPRNANYTMDAKLNVETETISGTMILNWHNITGHPANELQFHLYFNAWRNNKSSYLMKSVRSNYNLSEWKEDEWAYCDVKSMKIVAGNGFQETDLTPVMEFIQPDDGNEFDQTVLRVPLPRAVPPGGAIDLEIQWETKVPKTFSRTGTIGEYYFLAHWFPKIGVFEPDGTWNCHQFVSTEFYADYGVYDVKLTVPTGWVTGATGTLSEQQDNGDGTTTHRFYQEDVHEFAWTASPHFTVHIEQFEEPDLPSVEMRLLLMPDHADKRDRYFEATRVTLKYYGLWWGAYPYDHVTIVDPAYQSGSGGMEYPTFFTGGTRWLSPPEMRSPESVTVHEAGHQFWYGIIGNNEFEHAWLDEGFNTFSTTRTLETAYPPPVLTRRYLEGFIPVVFSGVRMAERTVGADQYNGFESDLKRDRMSTISWQQGPGAYGLNSYSKPGMMLRTLENYLGWDTFRKVMSTYFDRWKFKHPKPQDFFDVVTEVAGQDLSWFFEEAYNSSNVYDYGVGRVESTPVSELRGYVDRQGSSVFQDVLESDEDEMQYRSTIFVRRWGEAVFPVEVKITFTNDETVVEQWDGKDRWHRYQYQKPARVKMVEVDPEHKLVLDINYSNNSWTDEPKAQSAARKWALKWMVWIQNLMEFFAYFS